jgi:hypothetical protein
LLRAAARLRPRWVMSLDADELITSDDAMALRRFVECDAIPGLAYGFRVFGMTGQETYAGSRLWVYRLLAFDDDQHFPEHRLHLVPIPTSIPRDRWIKTTIRIQHWGGSTAARRFARYSKYLEADPDRTFQSSYEDLMAPRKQRHAWEPRDVDTPMLVGRESDLEGLNLVREAPVLSAVVIATDDGSAIRAPLEAALAQRCDVRFEVIVVVSGSPTTADLVRREFPGVTLIELPERVLPGRARNEGLARSRGEFVSFPGSHVIVAPGTFQARITAHERGYAMVTGSIVNGNRTRAGWASFFLDHSSALRGRPSGPLLGPPAHCSYEREALEKTGGFREDMRAGEDTVANERLWKVGRGAYRCADIELTHRSPCRTISQLAWHHFERGASMARVLLEERGAQRGALEFWLFDYRRHRLRSVMVNVFTWGSPEERAAMQRVRRLMTVAILAAWFGLLLRLLRSRPFDVLSSVSRRLVQRLRAHEARSAWTDRQERTSGEFSVGGPAA